MLLENESKLALPTNSLVSFNEDGLFSPENDLDVLDNARAMLTPALLPAVNAALEFLHSEARRHDVSVCSVNLYGHTSPEDGSEHIVITQIVDLPVADALAYRRQFYKAYNPWFSVLPVAHQNAIRNSIIPTIRWRSNGVAH